MTVKGTDAGIRQVVAEIHEDTYYGITVDGHCMGIVGRTWRDPTQSSGYAYASDGAKAVSDAGNMRTGKPPRGAVVWYSTGGGKYAKPGHVLTMEDDDTTIGNIGDTIERRQLGDWSLQRIGWCWPEEVPGWGKAPTPPPVIDESEDEDMFIFRTHENGKPDGQGIGGGAHYMVSHGHAVQCAGGYERDPEILVVSSPSEAMDEAFYASVVMHRL